MAGAAKTKYVPRRDESEPHVALDRESRLRKARKIERLLSRERPLAGARILDVGCGAGYIASALSEAAGPAGEVVGVDVADTRQLSDGFTFVQVTGTELPFEDASFDVVVSNHVLEHVGDGDRDAQRRHLREIRRLLRAEGVCYLAVPSRWTLVEPHFRLPLLSWLPQRLASRYVRAAGRGTVYDCRLPRRSELTALLDEAGLRHEEVTIDAMRVLAEVEAPGRALAALLEAPRPLLRALLPVVPTMVFLLRPR